MKSEQIEKQIADFQKRGGKIQKIERGLSATSMVGGPFNNRSAERNRTKRGGLGITVKERSR
jgi:hypothetical protein